MFKIKKDAMDHIMRYNARFAAEDYLQVTRVDFNETFAPLAKFNTIETIIAIRAVINLEMY